MDSSNRKATVDEIRARFDQDVERFSNIDTGQSATVDAPLTLDLIAAVARSMCATATSLLDIGCGAGNFTLKLMDGLPNLDRVTLLDLSRPMLDRARQRVEAKAKVDITCLQEDIRQVRLDGGSFDIVVAAAVLHHLRVEDEWVSVFTDIYRSLRTNGVFLISDLVSHEIPEVHSVMWNRYGEYLSALKGPDYRDHVFKYVTYEDTPRSATFQLNLLREVGFRSADILHKNSCFAALVAVK